MEMEVTTSSNKKADTNYSSSRWWLELDEEKPRDQDDQTMETDDSSKTEPSLADPFFGLFGDCSSYTNLKRQNKIGLFGLFPLNWRPEDACADGGYWLYSDQQMESTLQAAREALGNAKSTVYKSVYSARGSALLDRLVYHSPNSSPVLEACARLELEQGNWAKAEGLLRSLMQLQPGNEWAKSQRLSILPKVDAEDDERLALLESLREHLLAKQLTEKAKVVAYSSSPSPINSYKYEAYIRAMIYHTVAIEGNQMKPEEMEAVLKLIPTAAAGQNADDANANAMAAAATAIVPREWRRKARDIAEVLAMRQVMEKIGGGRQNGSSSSASTGRPALEQFSLEYLLDLHRLVLRNAPKYAGTLRQCNVRITNVPFQLPEWFLVEEEMRRFVRTLRAKQLANGVEFAAMIHYGFVHIHPFADGNGRMARLLVNFVLEEFGFPPIIFPLCERDYYFRTLFHAQMGDARHFIRYVAGLVEHTIETFLREGAFSLPSRLEQPKMTLPFQ